MGEPPTEGSVGDCFVAGNARCRISDPEIAKQIVLLEFDLASVCQEQNR
jgi:hypothetical protein